MGDDAIAMRAHRNRLAWIALARPAAGAMALLVTFAFACLTQAFVANDFSVVYVAQHSNSLLPIQYRVAGVWGGTSERERRRLRAVRAELNRLTGAGVSLPAALVLVERARRAA